MARTTSRWSRHFAVSTSILVILLGTGWLDPVLLPALAVFVGITLYALWRRQRTD